MGHYKSNLRDIEFTLFEVLGRQKVLGTGPYAEVDEETARSILAEVERLATGELAASLLESDRTPPVYDPATHSVTMPASFKKSYQAYMDAEWWRMDLPEELGGTVVPPSLRWAVAELILGSNPAVHMYASGMAFAHVIWGLGTAEQRKVAERMVDGRWGATMVLTEPDAGSDVGAGRTKAVQQADGTWHIEGVKRFITSAEHDMSENIVHLVLARPEGAGPGTKGLSLFIVPKIHFDWETGELGARNGVYVTNVEHKMGLKASTTCEITFGEQEPAVGWLVGEVHDGIAQMFRIIEFARMMVGTKAIATLSTGYLNALDYAKTRRAGRRPHQDDRQDGAPGADHAPPRRPPVADDPEGVRRGHAGPRPLHRDRAGRRRRGRGRRRHRRRARPRGAAQRPAAADREGVRLREVLRAAGLAVAADLRRLRLPAGLPDRAVHPGREDRHPVRGHHGDPGDGLLLPQDRAGQGPGADQADDRHPGVRQGRRGQRHPAGRARAARDRARAGAGRSSGPWWAR